MDDKTRDALVSKDSKSAEILKPILRGRDISRYRANWDGLWLISTLPSLRLKIDDYPAIKQHLISYGKERLVQDGRRLPGGGRSRKKTLHSWFELQDTCAYHDKMSKKKVVWIELVNKSRFAYDESGLFVEATAFMMTGTHMKYLCGFLNSRLANWYILKSAPNSGMGVSRWKKVYVNNIPVARPNDSVAEKICDLVDQAIDLAVSEKNLLTKVEEAIDAIIYKNYGLSDEEAQIIERATRD